VALALHQILPLQHQAKACTPFSGDAFLDGLVQFIVATNQVFYFILIFNFTY
jgi:hypothetical protein